MNIILLERVEKLGNIGDIVTVKAGYARNYLLPQNKAAIATKENQAAFEARKAQIQAENAARKEEAQKLAEQINGLYVTLIRQAGESGQLYGSVSRRDIAEAIAQAGFTIDRNKIQLNTPVKMLGVHNFIIILHAEVKATIKVNVAKSEEEAATQKAAAEAEKTAAAA